MKPGNLVEAKVPNPAANERGGFDIRTSSPSVCGFFIVVYCVVCRKKGIYNGKKTLYL